MFFLKCKAQLSGKRIQQQHKTSLDECVYNKSVQSWVKRMELFGSSQFPLYMDLPLYEVHHIGRAATGEPTLLE